MQDLSSLENRLSELFARFSADMETRLGHIEQRLEQLATTRHKSLEWVATLGDQIRSLDEFREEVRASFEPIIGKLEGVEEIVRIMRHATSDVSRRIETLERYWRKAG